MTRNISTKIIDVGEDVVEAVEDVVEDVVDLAEDTLEYIMKPKVMCFLLVIFIIIWIYVINCLTTCFLINSYS